MSNDSIKKTLGVASALCVVCSVLVSSAAVFLKPLQTENKSLDIKKSMLLAAKLIEPSNADKNTIQEAYKLVTPQVIELKSGEVESQMDPLQFDAIKMAKDPTTSVEIPSEEDLIQMKRRSKYSVIYKVMEGEQLKKLILPVYGKGLWSTLYGFLVLQEDLNTIEALSFYAHGETPGLGGEVDNPNWKQKWDGKKAFNQNGETEIQVIKGSVEAGTNHPEHKVDGLSGATITSRGVSNILSYWLGDHGHGPYLSKLRSNLSAQGVLNE